MEQLFQADNGMWMNLEHFNDYQKEKSGEVDAPVEKTSKVFCEFCTSRGHFHKKDCTRPLNK